MRHLELLDSQRTRRLDRKLLRNITGALLDEHFKVADYELAVHFVGDRKMAGLNQKHLGHSGSTDVITFPYGEPTDPLLTGELMVCVAEAVRQSTEFQTTWQSEVVRYIIHGILHLRGHDDLEPVARRRMKSEENRLLRRLADRFDLSKLELKTRFRP